MNERLLALILLLGVVISALHYMALAYSLYWVIGWFDIVMHFLGGFLIALIFITILLYTRKSFHPSSLWAPRGLFFLVFLVFLVGSLWELFEFFIGLHFARYYLLDTLTDLLMDSIGALGAAVFVATMYRKGVLR